NPPPEREDKQFSTPRKSARRRGRLGPLPAALATPEAPDHTHQWVSQCAYDYTTTDGEVVQQVIRQQCQECSDKRFRQAFTGVDGDLHDHKPDDFTPVLYHQPAVARAIEHGVPIWVLEGEKDADTAEGLDLVATTNTGGARSFPT